MSRRNRLIEPYQLKPRGRCQGADCVLLLLGKDTWTAIPLGARHHLSVVFARHAGRGLCSRCYERAKKAGALIDYETRHVPRELRATDYAVIRANLPTGSMYARLRAAGERLNCHADTVKEAVRSQGREP